MLEITVFIIACTLIGISMAIGFGLLTRYLDQGMDDIDSRVDYYKERVNKLETRVAVLESEIRYQDYKKSMIGEETRL